MEQATLKDTLILNQSTGPLEKSMTLLLTDLVESTPEIDEVVQLDSRWIVSFNDAIDVMAELDSSRDLLTLSTDLGRPPANRRGAVTELLLMYTSLMPTTQSTAMALTEPDGEFQQLRVLPVAQLDLAVLKSSLLDFTSLARLWREVVAQGGEREGTTGRVADMLANLSARA